MKEIEVKILEIDPEKILARLKELGAEFIEKGLVKVKAYDFHDKRLREADTFIRVREIAGRTEVVFKGAIENTDFKIREEIEFHTDNFEKPCKVFERLGMLLFADYEKYRVSYRIGNSKVEFDKHPNIPWFIEVEGPDTKSVEELVRKLGFSMEDKNVIGRGFHKEYGHNYSNEKFEKTPDYDYLFK